MRRATHGVTLFTTNEIVTGASLGYDFTAEHEWGIKQLQRAFGISDTHGYGIARRQITLLPPEVALEQWPDQRLVLRYARGWPSEQTLLGSTLIREELRPFGTATLAAAWDEGSFALAASATEDKAALVRLHQAFLERDVTLHLGRVEKNPFSNSCLILRIASLQPPEQRDAAEASDRSAERLQQAVKATGIEALLKEQGKKYFALSPRWKDEQAGEIVYWLNPASRIRITLGGTHLKTCRPGLAAKGPSP